MTSKIRVIAGKVRGRRLKSVPGDITRPITDRTKESLFNIIGPDIQGSTFLDLFAGTGSVGIEALSRGASFVRFIDIHRRAIDTIRSNLKITQLWLDKDTPCAEVIQADAFLLMKKPADRSFDYIYIAPPQYKEMWKTALLSIDTNPEWIGIDGWVISQIDPIEYEELVLYNLTEFDQRKYGSTLLVFYEVKA